MGDTKTKRQLGPPRIFIEVIREIEDGSFVQSRKEIDLVQFQSAKISIADMAINECLAKVAQYDRR